MAYLSPDFHHDVFVSYSHGDFDKSGQSKLKAWSQKLKAALEQELRVKPGFADVSLFMDGSKRPADEHSLDLADELTPQLRDAAESAALLLILMSPHYCGSAWCKDERNWWQTKDARQSFPEADDRRLLIARVWPTGDATWPAELLDERAQPPLGWMFFEPPGHPLTTVPFGWTDPSDVRFGTAVTDLSGVIAVRLDRLQGALERARRERAEAARLAQAHGQHVYLQGRDADRKRWDAAYDALDRSGFAVLPPAPEPDLADPNPRREREIVETLSSCDCALFVPSGDPFAMAHDLRIADARRHNARSMRPKPLPFAALDDGLPEWKQRARRAAEKLDIGWIEAITTDWPEAFRIWVARRGERA